MLLEFSSKFSKQLTTAITQESAIEISSQRILSSSPKTSSLTSKLLTSVFPKYLTLESQATLLWKQGAELPITSHQKYWHTITLKPVTCGQPVAFSMSFCAATLLSTETMTEKSLKTWEKENLIFLLMNGKMYQKKQKIW